MKTCTKCKLEKDLSEFGKMTASKDGYSWYCKTCKKEILTLYRSNPKIKSRDSATNKVYRENNKEVLAVKRSIHYFNNKEYYNTRNKQYHKVYVRLNRVKKAVSTAKRRALEKQASPKWNNTWFNKLRLEEIYLISETRFMVTGIKHHVDHVIPLQSNKVCGLHCIQNLRVVPAEENLSKGNKLLENL